MIYPSADVELDNLYEKLLAKSNEIFDDFTRGKHKPKPKIEENKLQS